MARVIPAEARQRTTFFVLWTLAVFATTTAFVLFLAMRVRSVELGYELGRAHARIGRLREVHRVLELELSSYKTPERINVVARNLFQMDQPTPERVILLGKRPQVEPESEAMPQARAPKGETP